MKVAVLDDDAVQRDAILAVIAARNSQAEGFGRAGALISMLRRETFDLLILDWNLPDRSGLDVVRWAHTHLDPRPPILLITSRTEDADIVEGLTAGADDYLTKPVSAAVLDARITALMRRTATKTGSREAETYGPYRFELLARRAFVADDELELTSKEFELALMLFRHANRAMSRAYLLEAVWGGDPNLNSRTLDVHISRIRAKLGLKPEAGYRLAPVYGYGYRLETVFSPTGAA